MAILAEDNRFMVSTDIEVDDLHPRVLSDPAAGEDDQVLCMAVVEPLLFMSGSHSERHWKLETRAKMWCHPMESCLQRLHMMGACL